MENKNPIWSRLWFIWLTLTVVYLILYFFASDFSSIVEKILFGVGLFVPYGFWNGSAFLNSAQDMLSGVDVSKSVPVVFVGVLALLVVIFGNRILNLFNLNPAFKLAISLIILIFLTFLADYSIWQSWPSLDLFLGRPNDAIEIRW